MKVFQIILALFFILISGSLLASSDLKAKMEFLGFTSDGKHFLLKTDDPNRGGTTHSIMQVGKPNPVESSNKGIDDEPFTNYKFTDKGKSEADGKSIQVEVKEDNILIKLAGKESKEIGKETLMKSTGDEPKKATVKLVKAFFSANGKSLVVIVHQKLEGEWDVDSDFVYSYSL